MSLSIYIGLFFITAGITAAPIAEAEPNFFQPINFPSSVPNVLPVIESKVSEILAHIPTAIPTPSIPGFTLPSISVPIPTGLPTPSVPGFVLPSITVPSISLPSLTFPTPGNFTNALPTIVLPTGIKEPAESSPAPVSTPKPSSTFSTKTVAPTTSSTSSRLPTEIWGFTLAPLPTPKPQPQKVCPFKFAPLVCYYV